MFGIPKSLYFIPLDAISFSSCDPCHWVSESVIISDESFASLFKSLSINAFCLYIFILLLVQRGWAMFHMFKIASFPPEDVNRLCGFPPAQADPARRSKGSRVISVKSFPTLEGNKIIDTRQEVKRNSDKIEKTNPMCFSLRSWGHLVENFLNFCNFYGRKNNSYLLRSSEV